MSLAAAIPQKLAMVVPVTKPNPDSVGNCSKSSNHFPATSSTFAAIGEEILKAAF